MAEGSSASARLISVPVIDSQMLGVCRLNTRGSVVGMVAQAQQPYRFRTYGTPAIAFAISVDGERRG
jgi:hypothetical protein